MIQIISQTNLDTVLFISDSAPTFQVAALNLGLIQKGFICNGNESIMPSLRLIKGQYHRGIQVRFTKMDNRSSRYVTRSLFKRSIKNEIGENVKLVIMNTYKGKSAATISIELTPPDNISTILNEQYLNKFSNHVTFNEVIKKVPNISISSTIEMNNHTNITDSERAELKNSTDTTVYRMKIFEEKHHELYPLLIMKRFSGDTWNHTMTFAEFERFDKYLHVIKDCSFPTNTARRKFIELCEIFRLNTILKSIKVNNLEFTRQNNCLRIKLFGITLAHELKLKRFLYFDHPGINFVADFVDKTNMFSSIEAKIGKEVFIRI